MAIYFKFKSAKTYNSVSVDGPFITVAALKQKIIEFNYTSKKKDDSNGLCMGTDFDILVMNAQTNDIYDDDNTLISANSSVLIRRVPGTRRRKPIDTTTIIMPGCNIPTSSASASASTTVSVSINSSTSSGSGCVSGSSENASVANCSEDTRSVFEYDDLFKDNIYLNVKPVPSSRPGDDEESKKIEALVNSPALDWQLQGSNGVGCGTRGANSRMFGHGFVGLDKRVPPEGYVCHRCHVPGHFIQHCPTNGDPNYDFKKLRPANPDGAASVLQPNEADFDKRMKGIASKILSSISDFPAELFCPLCKQVMKDAVLSSKCCFNSFCYKCIRDHLIFSKLKCACGATDMLVDYLVPNMTVRDTISSILESGLCNSSVGENSKTNSFRVEDMESARISQPMISASSSEKKRKLVDTPELGSKKARTSRATSGDATRKEAAAASSVQAAEEEVVQQKVVSGEMGKKKRERKNCQDVEIENYVMPSGYYCYNPYWGGMQMGMEGYVAPYYGGAMRYGLDTFGMPFNGVMPQAFSSQSRTAKKGATDAKLRY